MQFDENNSLKIEKSGEVDFKVYHISPIHENGFSILGELEKAIPMSEQRIGEIVILQDSLTIQLFGVVGEKVVISVAKESDKSVLKYKCEIG